MQILQDIISLSRNLRAEMKVDPKLALEGMLYSHTRRGCHRGDAWRCHSEIANVTLEIKQEHAPAECRGRAVYTGV